MERSGVVILDKPEGFTSHDCVNKLRRLYSTKKVGHTGTLDPMATGVLPILIGRAAKAADMLLAENKSYVAGLKLGITTDTEDTSGEILTKSDKIPSKAEVRAVCAEFLGETMQTPPMYSALKVDGQKLVDLARKGITIEREARPIKITRLDVEATESPDEYSLTVDCSKGTYIRTLCKDIGERLGCGGAMSRLRRTRSGNFTINESVTLDELESMTEAEREQILRPTESLFEDEKKVKLAPFYEKLSRSGCEIYQKKIKTDFAVGTRVRLHGESGFYALGEVKDFPDGSAIKVIKLFEL